MALLNTLTTSSAITLATLYLQNTLGHSPLAAGLMLLAVQPRRHRRIRPCRSGAGAGGAPQRLVIDRPSGHRRLRRRAHSGGQQYVGAAAVRRAPGGAGIGLSSVAATRLGTSVPIAVRGTASGIINTAAQLGTAVGIAALLLLATLDDRHP